MPNNKQKHNAARNAAPQRVAKPTGPPKQLAKNTLVDGKSKRKDVVDERRGSILVSDDESTNSASARQKRHDQMQAAFHEAGVDMSTDGADSSDDEDQFEKVPSKQDKKDAKKTVTRHRRNLVEVNQVVIIDNIRHDQFNVADEGAIIRELNRIAPQAKMKRVDVMSGGGIKLVCCDENSAALFHNNAFFGTNAFGGSTAMAKGPKSDARERAPDQASGPKIYEEPTKIIVDFIPKSFTEAEIKANLIWSEGRPAVVKVVRLPPSKFEEEKRAAGQRVRPLNSVLIEFQQMDEAKMAKKDGVWLFNVNYSHVRPLKTTRLPTHCTRCLRSDHSIRNCTFELRCSDCTQHGHVRGSDVCPRRLESADKLCIHCHPNGQPSSIPPHPTGYGGCPYLKAAKAEAYKKLANKDNVNPKRQPAPIRNAASRPGASFAAVVATGLSQETAPPTTQKAAEEDGQAKSQYEYFVMKIMVAIVSALLASKSSNIDPAKAVFSEFSKVFEGIFDLSDFENQLKRCGKTSANQ
jgi:hypothetical protein